MFLYKNNCVVNKNDMIYILLFKSWKYLKCLFIVSIIKFVIYIKAFIIIWCNILFSPSLLKESFTF
jgi:hypothetical protein